jgi:two-component system KDP operon response regulator KdpE
MSTSEISGPLVLVIEDDATVRQYLCMTLSGHGYRVIETISGREGMAKAAACQPNLILLDMGLPDMEGLEVTRQLREWTLVPILILSGRRQQSDKVAALDAGADDYITKPFGVDELLARVRVALRHAERAAQTPSEPLFLSGDLRLNYALRQVFVGENEVRLTPIEYRLLTTLSRRAGEVVTHRQLLTEVWGAEYARDIHYLRVYMKHLRDKLEADSSNPKYLVSEQDYPP